MSSPLISPRFQFPCAAPGAAAAGFKLNTYAAGTATPLATYTTAALTVQNANPVIMGADGCADVWLGQQAYKFVGTDAANNVLWTEDNVTQAGLGSTQTEWILVNSVPTKIDGSNFSLAGISDLTLSPYFFGLGTRIKAIDSFSTVLYATVINVVGNVVTVSTNTFTNPLVSIYYGMINNQNLSTVRRSFASCTACTLTNLTSGVQTALNLTGGNAFSQTDYLGEFGSTFVPKTAGVYRINGVVAINEFVGTLTVLSSAWSLSPTKNGTYLDAQQWTWPIANNIAASMLVPFDVTVSLAAGDIVGLACTASFTGTQMSASVRSFNVQRVN